MRTTVTLDDDVMRTIREEMKSGDGKTFKEAINELIRLGRNFRDERSTAKRGPFKVKAKKLGVYEHLKHLRPSELLQMLDEEEFLRKAGSKK